MQAVLEFFVLGLEQGALIAGVALALVLFHRASGIVNLAAGCVAMVTDYAYWSLTSGTFGQRFGTLPAVPYGGRPVAAGPGDGNQASGSVA